MAYDLRRLAADCREALRRESGPAGREEVRKHVERACADADFVRLHLGPDNDDPRKLLYEDPDLGFCIFAHACRSMSDGRPHDHGPSWAVYGQALGETEMVEWREVSPGRVEEAGRYRLRPGEARLYEAGDIHSPQRAGETRLLRVEGRNLDGVERRWFDPVD